MGIAAAKLNGNGLQSSRRELHAKSGRFNIRTSIEDKELVYLAANAMRVSASAFVMQAAVRQAEEVLADQTRFQLAPDKWEAFVKALDRPAREIPALKRAISKPSPFSDD